VLFLFEIKIISKYTLRLRQENENLKLKIQQNKQQIETLKQQKQSIEHQMDAVQRVSNEPNDFEILDQNKFQKIYSLLQSQIPAFETLKLDSHSKLQIGIVRKVNFICKFGSKVCDDGQFRNPFGVAIDGDGNIVVSDFNNHRIQIFDSSRTYIRKFGSEGSGDGQFQNPCGVAIDGDGNIVVLDLNNHRIQIFDSRGIFIRKFGSFGSGDGQFNNPLGVAIDGDGNIVVSDDH